MYSESGIGNVKIVAAPKLNRNSGTGSDLVPGES